MSDVLTRFNSGKIWDFDGGIHPPEMKSQSNQTPIQRLPLAQRFFVPVKQHAGNAGNLLVQVGDKVLKGDPLTQGQGLRNLPIHAPTSGVVKSIAPYIAAHPSGLAELAIEIESDGKDQWREKQPIEDFFQLSPQQLIDKIYQAGIAGLGGAVFPTAAKIDSAQQLVKLLIINGAECEPYITCDDRLMQDYADELLEGVRILRYILRPEQVVIAIEDNKPQAIHALRQALQGANDIQLRVIPTKYPSGDSERLIYVLTGMEVPAGKRSSSIGVLMQNVATAFAIKRAVIDDEPLIERVVTFTGDKIKQKGNYWVPFGTPISHPLSQLDYQYDERFPVYLGGPMMGLALPNLNAPITKIANCILAPDHFEYAPPPVEQSCIRCSACSDACPVKLMPQQLYWFARAEDHQKSEQYQLMDCIECGVCAYVCPSHIPLIQYFRQEKAKIWEIEEKARKAEDAKQRFEARQARLEKEEQARKARAQKAAEQRREEMAQQQGVDPVQAALERLKQKNSAGEQQEHQQKTQIGEKGELLPDNSDIMAQRKARRLAKEQAQQAQAEVQANPSDNKADKDDKKAAIAAALARAKARKAQQTGAQTSAQPAQNESEQHQAHKTQPENTALSAQTTENETENTQNDPKKATVAAAIARAKAKKLAQQNGELQANPIQANQTGGQNSESFLVEPKNPTAENLAEQPIQDPKKAAVAAAIARAKAKKLAQQNGELQSALSQDKQQAEPAQMSQANQSAGKNSESFLVEPQNPTTENLAEQPIQDPKKAAVAAAIARAKAKKLAQQSGQAKS